jgi:glutathione S-transferase
MLTLYFSPGACSTASHIGLEETGAPYQEKPTLLAKGEHKTEAYLKINPHGKVPALDVDGTVLTENTAILTYLARTYSEKRLLPSDPLDEARCISKMAWLSNTVHPAYTHILRPERYAANPSVHDDIKQVSKKTFWTHLQDIDGLLQGKTWIMGSEYTMVDPYALVFYGWGVRGEFPVHTLTAYTQWKERMLERPAVKKVLESEKNVLVNPG